MNFELYGLLYIDNREQSVVNVVTKNFQNRIKVYVSNAVTLSNSLKRSGIQFTLLTNRRDIVKDVLLLQDASLQIKEITFLTKVPLSINFYSAHFKLDAYRYLSSLKKDYIGLCDLDMVCINDIPQCLVNNIRSKTPLYYDISDQVIPAYGHNIIIRDIEAILGCESEGRWSGGEFIAGSPDFFHALVQEIDSGIYKRYIENITTLHHCGDEAFTSAALEKIRKNGMYISDAGTLGIVGRYWNRKVSHTQRNFQYYRQCFLLHLPADKKFLTEMSSKRLNDQNEFIKLYLIYKDSPSLKATRILDYLRRRFAS